MSVKQQKRIRRHKKIRMKIYGTHERPRLCIFRSNQHVYAQLVDDNKGKVLASVSDRDLKAKLASAKGCEVAKEVGKLIAKKAKELKVEKIIFDRGGFLYHGRIKALAEGAREEGIKF